MKIKKKIFRGNKTVTGDDFIDCTFNDNVRVTGNSFPNCTFSGSARVTGNNFQGCNFLGSFKGKKSNEADYSYSYNNYSENTNTNKNKFHFTNITCNSLNGGNYSGTINLRTSATNCTFETNSSIYGDNITYENCFLVQHQNYLVKIQSFWNVHLKIKM